MNFREFLLSEMPITNFRLVGQWGPDAKRRYGYAPSDTGILENPKAVEKIHKSWSNSKHNFELYFVRSSKARRHVEVGEVSAEWVKENLEVDIPAKEDSITIVFTNNTGAEKIPMTAWAMAHRVGHAIRMDSTFENYMRKEVERDFNEILKYVYGFDSRRDRMWGERDQNEYRNRERHRKALFSAVGKMKSARENKLRNSDEFVHELVAQYIITGKVEFRELPTTLTLDRRTAWGRPNYSTRRATDQAAHEEYSNMLHSYAEKYEYNLYTVFNGLEGKIFVM